MDNEQMDLQDKMGDMVSRMFRVMLGVNVIPLPVLKRYFAFKKPLDKIDGKITPGDMLRVCLDCGLNLDTMRFDGVEHAYEHKDIPEPAESADSAETTVVEQPRPKPEDTEIKMPRPECGDCDHITLTDDGKAECPLKECVYEKEHAPVIVPYTIGTTAKAKLPGKGGVLYCITIESFEETTDGPVYSVKTKKGEAIDDIKHETIQV